VLGFVSFCVLGAGSVSEPYSAGSESVSGVKVVMLVAADAGKVRKSSSAGKKDKTQCRKESVVVTIKSTRWKTEHRRS
jgi:hypothetical protein